MMSSKVFSPFLLQSWGINTVVPSPKLSFMPEMMKIMESFWLHVKNRGQQTNLQWTRTMILQRQDTFSMRSADQKYKKECHHKTEKKLKQCKNVFRHTNRRTYFVTELSTVYFKNSCLKSNANSDPTKSPAKGSSVNLRCIDENHNLLQKATVLWDCKPPIHPVETERTFTRKPKRKEPRAILHAFFGEPPFLTKGESATSPVQTRLSSEIPYR